MIYFLLNLIATFISPNSKTSGDDPRCFTSLVVLQARGGAGMFSILDDVYGLVAAYDHSLVKGIQIDFGKEGPYYEPAYGENWWNYYFQPVAFEREDQLPVYAPDYQPCQKTLKPGSKSPDRAKDLLEKYFRLRPEIEDEINQFVQTHFNGHYVIGVHYRGTDKASEAPRLGYEKVKESLTQTIASLEGKEGKEDQQSKTYRIYVATDEQPFIDYLEQEFPGRLLYLHAIRSTDGKPVHLNRQSDNYQVGKEALLDAILLSKTNLLLRTASNLSRWSTYFNPEIPVVNLTQEY